MQIGTLHLQGKVVGAVPMTTLPGAPTRPLLGGEEFVSRLTSLDDAIAAAKAYTAGPDKPGALIITGRGMFEAYALKVGQSLGHPEAPFHFEGTASLLPQHVLSEGVAFVDGDTVIRR